MWQRKNLKAHALSNKGREREFWPHMAQDSLQYKAFTIWATSKCNCNLKVSLIQEEDKNCSKVYPKSFTCVSMYSLAFEFREDPAREKKSTWLKMRKEISTSLSPLSFSLILPLLLLFVSLHLSEKFGCVLSRVWLALLAWLRFCSFFSFFFSTHSAHPLQRGISLTCKLTLLFFPFLILCVCSHEAQTYIRTDWHNTQFLVSSEKKVSRDFISSLTFAFPGC